MLRLFCVLVVAGLLCSCTDQPQRTAFKEKYNVYAELEIEEGSAALPSPDPSQSTIDNGLHLTRCDVPIEAFAAFADVIVRRMDARTLSEYLDIQDEIDTRYFQILKSPSTNRADEKYGTFTRHGNIYEDYVKKLFFDYYILRDEAGIRDMVATVQYTRYLMSARRVKDTNP